MAATSTTSTTSTAPSRRTTLSSTWDNFNRLQTGAQQTGPGPNVQTMGGGHRSPSNTSLQQPQLSASNGNPVAAPAAGNGIGPGGGAPTQGSPAQMPSF